MDNPRTLLDPLFDWIACHPDPPLVWAAHQKGRSVNGPSTLASVVFQERRACPRWEVGDRAYPLPAGHLVLISAHRGSRSDSPKDGDAFWNCAFSLRDWPGWARFCRRWSWRSSPVRAPLPLMHAYREVIRLYPLRTRGRGLRFRAALLQWMAVVREEWLAEGGAPPGPRDRIGRALDWMHAHYADSGASLARAAAEAGFSPHHFARVFRREIGQPPMRYLQGLRIAHSQTLLLNSALRIKEVAREVGFPDPLHFSRVFRHITGASPRQAKRHA